MQSSNVAGSRGDGLVFTKYLTDPGVARLEAEAKASHIGLWRGPRARPSWE